jgi:flagellar basal-body rod protein FlgB
VNDVTMAALQTMLRGLSARQRAIAGNVANLETPGYTAKKVEFETSLREALDRGTGVAAPSTVRSTNPSLPNGNNVLLEEEMVELQDTNLRYQLAIEAVTSKLNLIRSSMRSSI